MFDFIGHSSKSLFGTLNTDDLELINKNLDNIFADENKLSSVIRNQSTILRGIRKRDLWSELMKMYNASARQLKKVQTMLTPIGNVSTLTAN